MNHQYTIQPVHSCKEIGNTLAAQVCQKNLRHGFQQHLNDVRFGASLFLHICPRRPSAPPIQGKSYSFARNNPPWERTAAFRVGFSHNRQQSSPPWWSCHTGLPCNQTTLRSVHSGIPPAFCRRSRASSHPPACGSADKARCRCSPCVGYGRHPDTGAHNRRRSGACRP